METGSLPHFECEVKLLLDSSAIQCGGFARRIMPLVLCVQTKLSKLTKMSDFRTKEQRISLILLAQKLLITEVKEVAMKALASLMIILAGVSFLTGQEVEVEGEIVEVRSVIDPKHDVEILEVRMQIDDGSLVRAELSPKWYLGTDVKKGDIIMIKGQYDEKNRLMAREVEHENTPHNLRSEKYEPLWLRMQIRDREFVYDAKTERQMRAQIEELYIDENTHLMEAVIKDKDGMRYRARIAPVQYLENRLRVGDNIEIIGSEVKAQKDVVILGREIKNLRTQKDIMLRNAEGLPDWREEGLEFEPKAEESPVEPEQE